MQLNKKTRLRPKPEPIKLAAKAAKNTFANIKNKVKAHGKKIILFEFVRAMTILIIAYPQ